MIEGTPIHIIPLRIVCADKEYADGVNIFAKDIYKRLKAGELPQTSLPLGETIGQKLVDLANAGYDGVIAVMLSGALSGTYNLMRLIADQYRDQLPLKVRVYDSRNGSLGLGLTLIQLANDIQNGMGWDELTERRVPQLIGSIFPFFTVDTLEYLRKGGRIGKITATAGTLLHIKPIITFSPEGQLQSIAKVRGKHHLIDKLVALTVERCGNHRHYNLGLASGGAAPEDVALLRQKLVEALPNYTLLRESEIDGTLSVYIGDGVLGAGVQVLD